jgi:uncharacterized protein
LRVTILAAESLGVRSMATLVETSWGRILVDPGVALAPKRGGLKPHADELTAATSVQRRLRNELAACTHVVISHFHGDHHPMVEAVDGQLDAGHVLLSLQDSEIFAIGKETLSRNQSHRRYLLQQAVGRRMASAEGTSAGQIELSKPMPHGDPESRSGSVMMCRIRDGNESFVHASDIQFLDDLAVDQILAWQPDVLFASGPPLYLLSNRAKALKSARKRIALVAGNVGQLVLDHHLMRSAAGAAWLDSLSGDYSNICNAADFENQPRNLLEDGRKKLWGKAARRR